jgi:Family of unknown function (DUF6338)
VDLFSDEKLLRFFLFFMPGFVSLKFYDWLVPNNPRKFSDAILEVVGYSFFNYAVLCFWWLPLALNTEPDHVFDFKVVIQVLAITFIFPALWPILYVHLSSRRIFNRWFGQPIPSAWDKVFGSGRWFYATVHLKDGRRIGGLFERGSYASAYPDKETLYLQELWLLDQNGAYLKPVPDTAGILILADQIALVELFRDCSASSPVRVEPQASRQPTLRRKRR